MAITRYNPRTIWLGGPPQVEVNDIPASEVLTPGMLIERDGGAYKKHSVVGGKGTTFALDQNYVGKDYNETYAVDDLVWAGTGRPGANYLAWLQSGENVSDGDQLQSAGNGMLEPASTDANAIMRALENKDTTTGDARIRVEVI